MQKRYVVLIIILLMVIVGFGQRDKLVTRLLQVGIDRQFSTATLSSLGDGFTSHCAAQALRYLRLKHRGPVLLLRLEALFTLLMSVPTVRVILLAWGGRHPQLRVCSLHTFIQITLTVLAKS